LIFPIKLINDATSPIITNVTVTNITDNSATIKWDTNEIADSVVKYGKASGIYTEIERNPLFVGNHTIALAKLSPGTKYYFIVNSMDRSGNSAKSSECSFTTGSEWIEKAGHPPVALLRYKPSCPIVNQTVTFNASRSFDLDDPSGYHYNITSYDWDFGDGNTTTGKIVNHSYSSAGNYTINLTVTDNEGLTNSTTKVIYVGISLSPWIGTTSQGKIVSFNVSEAKVCDFNTSWNFTSGNFTNRVVAYGSFRIGPIDIVGNEFEFEWQFKDDYNDSALIYGEFISPNFASGFFRKTGTGYDTGNITWNATKVNELPMANFIFSPSQPIVNQLITLDASSTFDPDGYIASYKWDFGEGTN
ncbi:MAG: PKD domain-containing protein, partial [Methanophagales archaeon]|nr:PKD domain-containing protein [Methanophagales archaeon]